ncbi:MAG TPA: DUF2061 domain-containing protein [Candidatus Saccharibacteria bacterium]|nr:DUF2061 domain-containing protein [Candidatus Saccharibacteria bacterium]HMT39841.1 DUF2061 domain-containing protein [Candidatus Saccharibacteria bacterium]
MKGSKHTETHYRTFVKTITYRIVIVISIFFVTYYTTGEIGDALAITSITAVTGTILYYIHERVWNSIHWGKTSK